MSGLGESKPYQHFKPGFFSWYASQLRLRQSSLPLGQHSSGCAREPEALLKAFSTHSRPLVVVWMGTLNSMKLECSPLGVSIQLQFTIQPPHSAQLSLSDAICVMWNPKTENSHHEQGNGVERRIDVPLRRWCNMSEPQPPFDVSSCRPKSLENTMYILLSLPLNVQCG